MEQFAKRSDTERQDILQESANRRGIRDVIIEKDFWVCWTLNRLYALPEPANHIIFKGGTSLSKAYGLIERFSEDIDFDNNFAVYSNSQTSLNNSETFGSADQRFADEGSSTLNTLNTQAKSFSDLLYQFGLSNSFNINNYFNSDNNIVRNNLFEFNNLIEMVEKQLLDYKTVINSKLQTTRNK